MTMLIVIAAFIGVAALVGGVTLLFRTEASSEAESRLEVLAGLAGGKAASAEASVLSQPLDDAPGWFEKTIAQYTDVRLMLEQAEVNLSVTNFALISLGLGGGGAAICLVFGLHWGIAVGAAVALAIIPAGWVWWKRSSRLAAFSKQLPEALELISRALRAGHSLAAGMQLVADEMSEPIGGEFRRAYEEQNFGVSLEESLEDMTHRIPDLDLRFFATAVILQRQTGGDLAEILDKIGALIRERFKIYGQVQALTGEGRLSGVVLLALPPVLFLVMWRMNPGYVMVLFEDDLGKKMLAGAVVLQLIGAYVIRQIIDIRV